MKKRILVLNTKNGYCMQPKKCRSVAEALRTAEDAGMAF